jgi:hypothetical protein
LSFHDSLSRDSGMVSAGQPKNFLSQHSRPTRQNILESVVQDVAHRQDPGDVRRRNNNRVTWLRRPDLGVESLFAEPVSIPFRLNGSWFVGCGNHFHWDCEFVPSSTLLQLGKRRRSETANGRNGEWANGGCCYEWDLWDPCDLCVSRGTISPISSICRNPEPSRSHGFLTLPQRSLRFAPSPTRRFAHSPSRPNRSALESAPSPARYTRSG